MAKLCGFLTLAPSSFGTRPRFTLTHVTAGGTRTEYLWLDEWHTLSEEVKMATSTLLYGDVIQYLPPDFGMIYALCIDINLCPHIKIELYDNDAIVVAYSRCSPWDGGEETLAVWGAEQIYPEAKPCKIEMPGPMKEKVEILVDFLKQRLERK